MLLKILIKVVFPVPFSPDILTLSPFFIDELSNQMQHLW